MIKKKVLCFNIKPTIFNIYVSIHVFILSYILQADQILLTLFNEEIQRFENMLVERKCYYIKNVRVKKPLRLYDMVPHEYQLQLARDTIVVEIEELYSEIPHNAYNFTSLYIIPTLLNKVDILKCMFHTRFILNINIT